MSFVNPFICHSLVYSANFPTIYVNRVLDPRTTLTFVADLSEGFGRHQCPVKVPVNNKGINTKRFLAVNTTYHPGLLLKDPKVTWDFRIQMPVRCWAAINKTGDSGAPHP